MQPLLCLACPYTQHGAAHVVDARVNAAAKICALYSKAGHHIYCPIVHWHYVIQRFPLPTDYVYWSEHNHLMIAKSDALLVLTLPGWAESVGVNGEMVKARTLLRPVWFIDPNEPWRWCCAPPRANGDGHGAGSRCIALPMDGSGW